MKDLENHVADSSVTQAAGRSSTAAHTPLPWMAATKYSSIAGVPVVASTGARIANTSLPGMDAHQARAVANAAFIARACNSHYDLVDALTTLLDAVEGRHVTVGDCNQARAAIAKAEGNQ